MIDEIKISNALIQIDEGDGDPLLIYAELKRAKDLIDSAIKQVEADALEEAEKYEQSFEYKGISFERRDGRRNYDYSRDGKWEELNNARKEREGLMKQADKQEIYDGDGERIYPPLVTFSKSSLIVK